MERKSMVCVCSLPALKQGSLTHRKKNTGNQKILLVESVKGHQRHPDQKTANWHPTGQVQPTSMFGVLSPHGVSFFPF